MQCTPRRRTTKRMPKRSERASKSVQTRGWTLAFLSTIVRGTEDFLAGICHHYIGSVCQIHVRRAALRLAAGKSDLVSRFQRRPGPSKALGEAGLSIQFRLPAHRFTVRTRYVKNNNGMRIDQL